MSISEGVGNGGVDRVLDCTVKVLAVENERRFMKRGEIHL